MSTATLEAGSGYKLYSVAAIVMVTFLGSPVAGGTIMAMNYNRLGDTAAARNAVLAGIGITVLLLAIGWTVEHSINIKLHGISLLGIVAMYFFARHKLAVTIRNHLEFGGVTESLWKAFGIGLFFLPLMLGLLAIVIVLMEQVGIRL